MLGVPKYVSQEEYTIGCTERGWLREPLRRSQEAASRLFWSRDVGPRRARREKAGPGGERPGVGLLDSREKYRAPRYMRISDKQQMVF